MDLFPGGQSILASCSSDNSYQVILDDGNPRRGDTVWRFIYLNMAASYTKIVIKYLTTHSHPHGTAHTLYRVILIKRLTPKTHLKSFSDASKSRSSLLPTFHWLVGTLFWWFPGITRYYSSTGCEGLMFIYYQVLCYEIPNDVFTSLIGIWRAFRLVKYRETRKNQPVFQKKIYLLPDLGILWWDG